MVFGGPRISTDLPSPRPGIGTVLAAAFCFHRVFEPAPCVHNPVTPSSHRGPSNVRGSALEPLLSPLYFDMTDIARL